MKKIIATMFLTTFLFLGNITTCDALFTIEGKAKDNGSLPGQIKIKCKGRGECVVGVPTPDPNIYSDVYIYFEDGSVANYPTLTILADGQGTEDGVPYTSWILTE
ncbi:MAG: hypothetical protein M3Q97_05715 [Bacteroidota bacterium]|nr:hypothetical protein [Bacteroidota bacterium]